MKELKREIKTMETYGWEATDGTMFNDKDECAKYEKTCKCVIRSAFINEVKFCINEYKLVECGGEDYGYAFVDVTEKNIDAINKALVYSYPNANLVTPEYIGKEIMVGVEFYNGVPNVGGWWTTLDDIINGIKERVDSARKANEKGA